MDTSSYQALGRASFGAWVTIHSKVEQKVTHYKIVAGKGFIFASVFRAS